MSQTFLQTENLMCERDGRLLFEQLNFSVQNGDMLQVVGPNGSGKTSLLRLLAGLRGATEGQILLQGKPLNKCKHELANHILWIGHSTGIKGLLSAEENLAWLCALHQVEVSLEQIWQALAKVGLVGFEDVPCYTLSAGQQRRVSLARLYLPAPPLWILDEPFTALDKQAVEQLELHLCQHCEQGGLVIFTTHHHLAHSTTTFKELDLGQASK